MSELGEEGLESALFVIVNSLNIGYSDNDVSVASPKNKTNKVADKEKLARLNMLAER